MHCHKTLSLLFFLWIASIMAVEPTLEIVFDKPKTVKAGTTDVKIDGEDLDPDKSYTISMTQFLLTGGNGYTMFDGAEILSDTMLADNEVVAKYIEENLKGQIPDMYEKPLGRISWKAA